MQNFLTLAILSMAGVAISAAMSGWCYIDMMHAWRYGPPFQMWLNLVLLVLNLGGAVLNFSNFLRCVRML